MSAFRDARCEDESGNSACYAGEGGKTQRHKGANKEVSKKERNIASDRWHTFLCTVPPQKLTIRHLANDVR